MKVGLPLPILRVPAPPSARHKKAAVLQSRLEGVLGLVEFPASPWQIAVATELYGSDCATRQAVRELKETSYPDAESVIEDLLNSALIFDLLAALAVPDIRPAGRARTRR